MILKWFLSRTVRLALQMRKHVGKILSAQRDLLSAQAIEAVEKARAEVRAACEKGDKKAILASVDELEKVANKWLKPYPRANIRENIEVMLVAIGVAMGIRTFFLQPFKIPTGSMQPTLYGIHFDHLSPEFKIPNRVVRLFQYWTTGVSYEHVVARTPGTFQGAARPVRFALFNLKQRFRVGNSVYTLWFPADNLLENLTRQGHWINRDGSAREFQPGEDILKLRVVSGDHLFVDRLTYNFRRPQRGEIIVFETRHVVHENVPQDQFYIKRLVGLGNETLEIGPDQRLIVDGKPLTASTPHFEFLYSFTGDYKENAYYGHYPMEKLAPGFSYAIPPNQYFALGDNTRNSLDSRYWGAFPREDVIGKAYFVYWPISKRFGWGYR